MIVNNSVNEGGAVMHNERIETENAQINVGSSEINIKQSGF